MKFPTRTCRVDCVSNDVRGSRGRYIGVTDCHGRAFSNSKNIFWLPLRYLICAGQRAPSAFQSNATFLRTHAFIILLFNNAFFLCLCRRFLRCNML